MHGPAQPPNGDRSEAMLLALMMSAEHWTSTFDRIVTREDFWYVIANVANLVNDGPSAARVHGPIPVKILCKAVAENLAIDERTIRRRLADLQDQGLLALEDRQSVITGYDELYEKFDSYAGLCLDTFLSHVGWSKTKIELARKSLGSRDRIRLVRSVLDEYAVKYKQSVITFMNDSIVDGWTPSITSENHRKLFTATSWYLLAFMWQRTVRRADFADQYLNAFSYKVDVGRSANVSENSIQSLLRLFERFSWVQVEKSRQQKLYLLPPELAHAYSRHLWEFDQLLRSPTGPLLVGLTLV